MTHAHFSNVRNRSSNIQCLVPRDFVSCSEVMGSSRLKSKGNFDSSTYLVIGVVENITHGSIEFQQLKKVGFAGWLIELACSYKEVQYIALT